MNGLVQVIAILITIGCIGSFFPEGSVMAKTKTELKTYKQKRNFKQTPEPKPKKQGSRHKNVFCIQKHHATHLHYDLRIELNGVLKSWAVPKGPSIDPSVKRLAIAVEDHPLHYATFEGIIPRGYGAGTVIVWDIGTFKNITKKNRKIVPLDQAWDNGHIELELHGQKLQGKFILTRISPIKNWLFFKKDDEFASTTYDPVSKELKSALSNATIEKLDEIFQEMKDEIS